MYVDISRVAHYTAKPNSPKPAEAPGRLRRSG